MNSKITLAVCAALLLAAARSPGQFVEVAADIEITSWRHQEETGLSLKNSRTYAMRCVVGTNTWLIENQARATANESVWFVDGKIIRQLTLTQDSISDDPVSGPRSRMLRRGTRSANILVSPDGYPGGDLFLNLPWFAFCSGSYLKRPDRMVPLPAPMGQGYEAFGFQDETTVFADSFGLPKRVAFYTAQRHLKCEYLVQQSTNVSGWNFPTAFTVVQNKPNNLGQWNRELSVVGRVTSIRRAKKPVLPEDLQERLRNWEQMRRK